MPSMIVDTLQNADRYVSLHPDFQAAFRYLRTADLDSLPDGRHDIEGDRLFGLVARSTGRGRSASPLEIHRKYIDIQYVVRGADEIGWKPLADCSQPADAFNVDGDIGFYRDAPDFWIGVNTGSFAIFFPEDAHAPLGGEGAVMKAVLKVAV